MSETCPHDRCTIDPSDIVRLDDRLRAVEVSTAQLTEALKTLTSINESVEMLVKSDAARTTKEKIAVWVGNAILMGIAYIIGLLIQQFIGGMKW